MKHIIGSINDSLNFFYFRSNPIYTEEEEQEVVIMVDSLDETGEGEAPEPPRMPRRAPSTSSGWFSMFSTRI